MPTEEEGVLKCVLSRDTYGEIPMRTDKELLEEILEGERKEELREQRDQEELARRQQWLQTEAGKRHLESYRRQSKGLYYYEDMAEPGSHI